jgi:aspartyl-tRNA(Asn)/glutamyl-tRNA(Gln) amidotransferase subunit B
MEEGSLRIDTNISVRLKGEQGLRNKIEIKNMNSFNFMELALKSEIYRQIEEYLNHPDMPSDEVIQQATYRWDPEKKETVLMRRKETADDYRYFPEPDLVPIVLTDVYIEEIRQSLPELPLQRERRYMHNLGLSQHQAFVLTSEKALADYFEETLKTCSNARNVANWLLVEFTGRLKESGESILSIGIKPEHVASLVNMIDKGTITGRIAKSVADEMVAHPGVDPTSIVAENPDYQPLNDKAEIERYVDKVLVENGESVAAYKGGRDKAFAFLVGQVMKLCRGKAAPQLVNELLKQRIEKM